MFSNRVCYDSSTIVINAVNRVSVGKILFLASLQQTCNEYLHLNINKCKLAFLLQKPSSDYWVIWLIEFGEQFSENRSMVLREPEQGSPRTRARFSENQSTVLREPEHGSPRTRAHLSWRTGEHLSWEPENISMFSIFSAFSMFSTCSELTPRAPIPDGRMERFMHPW